MKILGQVRLLDKTMQIIAGPWGRRYLLHGPSDHGDDLLAVQKFGKDGLPEDGILHINRSFFASGEEEHQDPDRP